MSDRYLGDKYRAQNIARAADKIFEKMGIDPALASIAALEAEMFAPEQFADQMIIRRVQKNISRQALSSVLGWDDTSIGRWESGRNSPKLVTASQWANVLG
ncbi:MAG: helix-turn-helix transcriptional regulator, partial [Candidatus Sulfotelmatobacter sp.]